MPAGDPFGDVMNTMPKYVVSTTLTTASAWRNSTLIRSKVVEEVPTLKAQPGKNIAIDGSSVLVHTLAEHDLIDEYSLLVYPVVLGSGKKLFPEGLRVHLQEIHAHQDASWQQVELAVTRGTGTGYDEALRFLIELREAAVQFKETQKFQDHFRAWVPPHLRRPSFVKRLQAHTFTLPEA